MNAPDFEPQRIKNGTEPDASRKFQDGDSVQLRDSSGNPRTGVVLELLASGRYLVKSGGARAAMDADALHPVGEVSEAAKQFPEPGQAARKGPEGPSSSGPPPVIEPPKQAPEKSSGSGMLDSVQTGLDGVGVVEPTPFADGTNSIISLIRAATDPERRGEHLTNAGISALGIIPYIGDLAKGLKYGGKAGKAAGAAKAAKATELKSLGGNIAGVASEFLGSNQNTGGGSGGSPPPDSPGGTSNDGDDGLEKNVKPLTDRVVELTGVLGKAAVVTYGAANTISLMNRAAIEYHRNLTGFNGQISGAYGKLEADRMQRKIKEGSEVAAPLSNLVASQSELESVLQDFNSPFRQMAMDAQSALTDLATIGIQILDVIEPFSELYPVIRTYFQRWGLVRDIPAVTQSMDWINEMRKKATDAARRGRKV